MAIFTLVSTPLLNQCQSCNRIYQTQRPELFHFGRVVFNLFTPEQFDLYCLEQEGHNTSSHYYIDDEARLDNEDDYILPNDQLNEDAYYILDMEDLDLDLPDEEPIPQHLRYLLDDDIAF